MYFASPHELPELRNGVVGWMRPRTISPCVDAEKQVGMVRKANL
jgi:hypothetical protein